MKVAPGTGQRSDGHPAKAAPPDAPPLDEAEDESRVDAEAVDLDGIVRRSPARMRLVVFRPFALSKAESLIPCLRAMRTR